MHRLPDKDGNPYPTRDQCYITCTKTTNSNQEWTNLILKKVILPELGMDMTMETSPEQIGLIWDEFRGHSAAIVKEYFLSLSFFIQKLFLAVSPLLLNLLIKLLTRFSRATSEICMIFTSSRLLSEKLETQKRPQDSCWPLGLSRHGT